nr:MAG TPA: hypothetical protein [Caudoviricetes sp.]
MIRKLFNLISVGILVVVLPYLIFYILQSDYSWNTFLHPGSWHWFNRLFGFQLPLIFVLLNVVIIVTNWLDEVVGSFNKEDKKEVEDKNE